PGPPSLNATLVTTRLTAPPLGGLGGPLSGTSHASRRVNGPYALSRLLPRSAWSALLPRPQTILRWHRDLVRLKWAAFHQCPPGQRPARDPERRALILRLARENPIPE